MKSIWWFVAFVCLSGSIALAQNAQLSGVVKDKTGAVVPQAVLTLKNVDTAVTLQTRTSKVGFFVFPSVQPGRYDLSAVAKGFDETVVNGIKVDTAANVTQDLILQIKTGGETVTVVQKADLDDDDGTVSTVIEHEFIENMPLNGSDLTTLFELTPGTLLNASGGSAYTGGGFSVDGQRATANYLTVDGASGEAYIPTVNGTSYAGTGIATSASGGTNGILPIDAIEEYRMDTSTYTAENGRTPGGQIQVRTRSGTNQFHGTLFENFRNQVLDAEDWFTKYDNLTQSPLRMNEFGGTLGGPILRNKIFFFLADDNLLFNQPNTTTRNDVPDASLRNGAYSIYKTWLSIFPAGNGGQIPGIPNFDYYNASYSNLIRDYTTSTRTDWQLPKSIRGFFRINIAPSSSTAVEYLVDNVGSHINLNTYTGGLTIPIGSHIVDDLTVNRTGNNTKFSYATRSLGGNTSNALQDNLPTGVNSSDEFEFDVYSPDASAASYGLVGPAERNDLHQWNIVNKVAFHKGSSTFKAGVDFLRRESIVRAYRNEDIAGIAVGNAPPNTTADVDTGLVTGQEVLHTNANPNISLDNFSLFVNDDWKLTPSLTLNAGLRWELDPAAKVGPLGILEFEGDNLDPASFQVSISVKPLYQTRYDNFAPRFGFAWLPRVDAGMVIRGGVGIYFDTGQAATVAAPSAANYPYVSKELSEEISYASVDWTNFGTAEAAAATTPLYLVDPHLLSPRTYEWSLTVDQALGKFTKLTSSYIGNDGEKLIGQQQYYNGENASGLYPVNTTYVTKRGNLYIARNQSHSNYQAIQMQLSSRLDKELSLLASYTWEHAEDNGSSDFSAIGAAALNPMANSANDIPQMFATAIHYAPHGLRGSRIAHAITSGWGMDTIIRLQSASPITVAYTNTANDNVNGFTTNADVVAGVPTVLHEHVDSYGDIVPGNKLLNWAAFTSPPLDSTGNQLRNGNSPTNGYRLFGLKEWDLAASRTLRLYKGINLNFRVDAFNLLNTATFADVASTWNSGNASSFGRSEATYANTYGAAATNYGETGAQLSSFENGGPRELQLSLKLKF